MAGADAVPEGVDAALGVFAQDGLDPGEEVFDRMKAGAVRRQVEQFGVGRGDGSRMPRALWPARLSMMTMSPGASVGARSCSATCRVFLLRVNPRAIRNRQQDIRWPWGSLTAVQPAKDGTPRRRTLQRRAERPASYFVDRLAEPTRSVVRLHSRVQAENPTLSITGWMMRRRRFPHGALRRARYRPDAGRNSLRPLGRRSHPPMSARRNR